MLSWLIFKTDLLQHLNLLDMKFVHINISLKILLFSERLTNCLGTTSDISKLMILTRARLANNIEITMIDLSTNVNIEITIPILNTFIIPG